MARKGTIAGWEALKPGYRHRLEQRGYTRADYLAGRSRQAARGHGSTPEKPSRVRGRETEYREYLQRASTRITVGRRQALAERVTGWMIGDFAAGNIRRIDAFEIESHIGNMDARTFLHAEQMSISEWQATAAFAAGRMTQDQRDAMLADWEYGQYDDASGHWINPFWYH